jgi:hypothetical protein
LVVLGEVPLVITGFLGLADSKVSGHCGAQDGYGGLAVFAVGIDVAADV